MIRHRPVRVLAVRFIVVLLMVLTGDWAQKYKDTDGAFDASCNVWVGEALAVQNNSVPVTFTVTIPFWTPENDSVFLAGSVFSTPVLLSQVNDVTWTGTVDLPLGEFVNYRYTRGTPATQAIRRISFTVSESDSSRYDAVIGWENLENPVLPRDNYTAMAALADFPAPFVINGFWDRDGSGNYSDLSETYQTIRQRAGLNWVGFPEAAFHSQLLPLPVIVNEDQGQRDLNEEELARIAQMARAQGLKYYVHAGNPGITQQLADQLGTDNPFAWIPDNIADADTVWWNEWFRQWGDFIEPKAEVAESIGIELFSIGGHLDYADLDGNVCRWLDLIDRIRSVYSGKLTYFSLNFMGPNPAWAYQLDYIGVYMGRPIASNNDPTLSELVDGISAFVDEVPHPKPVVFFLDFASIDSAAMGAMAPDILEPTAHLSIDFQEQADIYEAFFRVMESREWIAGLMSWNYAYDDDFLYYPDPEVYDDTRFTASIRNKLAEAVTFKWRHAFDTTATAVSGTDVAVVPENFRLFPNHPNPFNSRTTIQYQLTEEGHVTLKVYNIVGQEVSTLADEIKQPGVYRIEWDGLDHKGRRVDAGLYALRLSASGFAESNKMLLVR